MSKSYIEKFEPETIDKICSFTGDELYKLIYENENISGFNELNYQKKWKEKECIEYLDGNIRWCHKVRENGYKWTSYYNKSAKCPNFGREYSSGIQRLPREIRGFLTGANYTDVDMANCHLVLLIDLFKKEELPVPDILQNYCDDRANILRVNNISKLDVLTTINKDRLYNCKNMWLHELHTSLKDLKDQLWDKNKELHPANLRTHKKSSVMNKLLCKEEAIILEMVLKELDIKDPVKMFDGFMYQHSSAPNESLIHKLNKLTEKWNIKWTEKPPQPFIYPPDREVTPYVKEVKKCLIHLTDKEKEIIPVTAIKTYESVKTEFEKDNFITLHPLMYCSIFITPDGEEILYRENKTNFWNKYEPLCFDMATYNKEGEMTISKVGFIKKWLGDATRKTYDNVDFLPPPLVCPPTTYNLYRGMRYELLEKQGVVADDDIEVFLNHIKLLSGSENTEEVSEYLIKYFAHIIQFPGILPGTGIILNSPQGYGKNIFCDNFGYKILGFASTLSTANAERFVGRWRNVMGKFIGIYNEASCKDTFGLEGKLKELITEPMLDWEEKGKAQVSIRSFIRIVTLSNKDNPIQIEVSDRRWQVIEITGQAQTKEYFDRLGNAFNNDAKILGFVNYLKKIDLSKWNAQRDRVETGYYKSLKSINIHPRERFLAQFAMNLTDAPGEIIFSPTDFYSQYIEFMENKSYKPESSTMFGLKMKNEKIWGEGIWFKRVVAGRRYYFDKAKLINILLKRGVLHEDDLEGDDDVFEEE